jgi:hypothetical protein
MSSVPPLPQNAPGPFYGTGNCTACGAPEAEAPDLLAPLTEENWDTYFVRQPATPDEVECACRAVEVCCLNALRYGGNDSQIIRRLGNRSDYCDHLLPGGPVRMPGENDYSWSLQARSVARTPVRRWWHRLLRP